MKTNLTNLTNEELKSLLHTENYKFSQGIEKGLPFDSLQQIRAGIRQITNELERRNLARFSQRSSHSN